MTQRSVSAEAVDRLETVAVPDTENFMDVIRAIGAMPIKKLQPLYAELFGHEPMVTVTLGEGDEATEQEVLSPNRKQLVRLCQFGVQYLFYVHVAGGQLPPPIEGPTEMAFGEELVENSPRAGGKRVSRGPTIKSLVLKLLAGEEGEYEDPETGETKTGMVVVSNEEIFEAVKEKFPDSKFDKTHLAWYLTQYRKGKFEKDGYGGETGAPLGILTRDIVKGVDKREREAAKAKKEAEKAAKKADKEVDVEMPTDDGADPLDEFDDTSDDTEEVADEALS